MNKSVFARLGLLLLLVLALNPASKGQSIISTIAGCGIGDDSLATRAELAEPVGIARDTAGNTYISDLGSYRIRKISASGIITTFAGTGVFGNAGDGGPATNATIGPIYGIAADRAGNVYFTSYSFDVIRKINPAGIISTIGGNGTAGYSGDGGSATLAQIAGPLEIICDTTGNILFTEFHNYVVRKITTSGIISTMAGNGSGGTLVNGSPATATTIGRPYGLALDNKGNLFIGVTANNYICEVNSSGILNIIAGTGVAGYSGDGGPATAATLDAAAGIVTDTSNHVYFSDGFSHCIRKIDLNTGIITTIGGTGIAGYSGDGSPATAAMVSGPWGLIRDQANNLYVADSWNNRIREINVGGIASTFAGMSGLFEEGYNPVNTELSAPQNLALDASGNLYIADIGNQRIREINASTGLINTAAGSGIGGGPDGFSGDGGPATAAHMYFPSSVAFDAAGNIYITDQDNQRVRKVTTSGIISTIAGNGTFGYSGDGGSALGAELKFPTGVVVDRAGNVYICDNNNHCIRKVNTSGIISTIAGNGGAGYAGDGGPASSALLSYPSDVAMDGMGNLYISDGGNDCIRKIDTSGNINTVVGTGHFGFSGDGGPANLAQLGAPYGMKSDSAGNLYIADHGNNRVRMVTAAGIIYTIAGNGTAGFGGDGNPAISAMLNGPTGIAVDKLGDVYISDGNNSRVRKITHTEIVNQIKNQTKDISVYPNPAKDNLTIITNINNVAGSKITLCDLLGNEVYSGTMTSSTQMIDLHEVACGMYILQVTFNNGNKRNVKVVKE